MAFCKYKRRVRQYSLDGGITWLNVSPIEYDKGSLVACGLRECEDNGSSGETPTVYERWVTIPNEYLCNGVNKHYKLKKQVSVDGINWTDAVPLEERAGQIYEENSPDCNGGAGIQYERWVVIESSFICDGVDKYEKLQKQVSSDNYSWTSIDEYKKGNLIETDSVDCGWVNPITWVSTGEYVCFTEQQDDPTYTIEWKEVNNEYICE